MGAILTMAILGGLGLLYAKRGDPKVLARVVPPDDLTAIQACLAACLTGTATEDQAAAGAILAGKYGLDEAKATCAAYAQRARTARLAAADEARAAEARRKAALP